MTRRSSLSLFALRAFPETESEPRSSLSRSEGGYGGKLRPETGDRPPPESLFGQPGRKPRLEAPTSAAVGSETRRRSSAFLAGTVDSTHRWAKDGGLIFGGPTRHRDVERRASAALLTLVLGLLVIALLVAVSIPAAPLPFSRAFTLSDDPTPRGTTSTRPEGSERPSRCNSYPIHKDYAPARRAGPSKAPEGGRDAVPCSGVTSCEGQFSTDEGSAPTRRSRSGGFLVRATEVPVAGRCSAGSAPAKGVFQARHHGSAGRRST